MMEFDAIFEYTRRPQLFEKSTSAFWDDEHISSCMLEAHLDPGVEAASRKHEFIDRSVNWILEYTRPVKGAKVLDLGCGPGLYAERLAARGLKVTGIDFSKRSPHPHICLESSFIYPEHATYLRQYVIIDKDAIEAYRTWDHAYTAETIRQVLANGGFAKAGYFSDVGGTEYRDGTDILGVAAAKPFAE